MLATNVQFKPILCKIFCAFPITGPLWGESTGGFPSLRPITQAFMFVLCQPKQTVEQNSQVAGDLRGHAAHYDPTVMTFQGIHRRHVNQTVYMSNLIKQQLHCQNTVSRYTATCTEKNTSWNIEKIWVVNGSTTKKVKHHDLVKTNKQTNKTNSIRTQGSKPVTKCSRCFNHVAYMRCALNGQLSSYNTELIDIQLYDSKFKSMSC